MTLPRFQAQTFAAAIPVSEELADAIREHVIKCEHCGLGPLLIERRTRWYLHLMCVKCNGRQKKRKVPLD